MQEEYKNQVGLVLSMRELFRKIFHKHSYSVVGTLTQDTSTIYFLECETCGERRILLDDSFAYSKQATKIFNLWKRHELEIKFDEENENA